MEINPIISDVGQVVVTLSFIWYMVKRNDTKLDKIEEKHDEKIAALTTDVAVIKTQILSAVGVALDAKADHDKITKLEVRADRSEKDLNELHQKHREVKQLLGKG